MSTRAKFLVVGVAAVLAGCSGMGLQKAEMQSASGSEFQNDLRAGYVDLSSAEFNEGDYKDSDYFAEKAIQSGSGNAVQPTMIAGRTLPGDKVDQLTSSRERLMRAMADGAADKAPADAARAQVAFDCWMQEQEENFQPGDIESCKGDFFAALGDVEKALEPAQPKVAAAPAPEPQKFVVYFANDSADIDPAAQAILAQAEAAAAKLGGAKVTIAGYADTTGTDKHNLMLSERRAEAITKLLSGSAKDVESMAFGQTNLAVPTPDGVAEAKNRRVEITVEP